MWFVSIPNKCPHFYFSERPGRWKGRIRYGLFTHIELSRTNKKSIYHVIRIKWLVSVEPCIILYTTVQETQRQKIASYYFLYCKGTHLDYTETSQNHLSSMAQFKNLEIT